MFNEGAIIYNKDKSARCLVRWARDDRFGWTYEDYSHIQRDIDVNEQGDSNFKLIQDTRNESVRIKRKTGRITRNRRAKRIKESKIVRGGFFN